MGPKTAASKSPETLEDVISVLKSLSAKFDTFTTKLASVENLAKQVKAMDARMASLEAKLTSALETNKELSAEIKAKEKALDDLSSGYTTLVNRCNDLEQYNRAWSVRIFNIPLTEDEEKDVWTVRDKVYDLAFLPILQGALEAGDISTIPSAEELLETAHVLPGKPGSAKPVIARFYCRSLKTLCLRKKRDFATKTSRGPPAAPGTTRSNVGGVTVGSEEGGRYSFPFYEDLTKATFLKMRALNSDQRVLSCWSINGQLRIKLTGSGTVKRVGSVYDSVDSIIGS
jgi:uncharacterized coiled-coil protein SlyX